MKKYFLSIITLSIIGTAAKASPIENYGKSFFNQENSICQEPQGMQQPPSPKEMAKHETEWMKEKLSLDSKQLVKVDSINLVYANKFEKFMKEDRDKQQNREAGREKMQEFEKQKRAELQKILTAEQLKKYDAELETRHKQGPPQRN
jgi:hypothetical protein